MEQSPFLTHIEEAMYQRRYVKRTIETYVLWIRRFIVYHKKRHPRTMGNQEVEQFLSYLVIQRHVAPTEFTQSWREVLLGLKSEGRKVAEIGHWRRRYELLGCT